MPLFIYVTVRHRRLKTLIPQRRPQTVRHHHRPVPPAGASDTDGEIRFPLTLISRQQVTQQIGDSLNGLAHLRLIEKKLDDLRVLAAEMLKVLLKIRIWQM